MNDSKDRMNVVILTENYKILGKIANYLDARLTDYMVEAKSYIAVTAAEVFSFDGNKVLSAPFMNVHRDKIEIILPAEDANISENFLKK